MSSTPERQAPVSSRASDILKSILERVLENNFITKTVYPKCNPDEFDDLEDQVYGALVSRQLEWLTSHRLQGDASVETILRALLMTSLKAADRVRLKPIIFVTEMCLRLKVDAVARGSQKVDAYVADLLRKQLHVKVCSSSSKVARTSMLQILVRNIWYMKLQLYRQLYANRVANSLHVQTRHCMANLESW
jgi:hypothetical protein